jgi:hypothetical protein
MLSMSKAIVSLGDENPITPLSVWYFIVEIQARMRIKESLQIFLWGVRDRNSASTSLALKIHCAPIQGPSS